MFLSCELKLHTNNMGSLQMSINADCVWSQGIDFVLSQCLLLDKVKRILKCLQTIKKKKIKNC